MATAANTKFCGFKVDASLWDRVRIEAIRTGKTIPQFVADALRAALPAKKAGKQ